MTSENDIPFACSCGQLSGRVTAADPRKGTLLSCSCADCRANEIYHGEADPGPSGIELFQTTADRIRIDEGAEHLAVIKLSPGGMFRWYAACCGTPLVNTLRGPGLPFVSIRTAVLGKGRDALGPVIARSFIPGPRGEKARHTGTARMVIRLILQIARARLSGRWRDTPFFDVESGYPVAKPHVLTEAERAAALSG